MIKCGKFLAIKIERSATQSEGCDARPSMGRQLHFALQPSLHHAKTCQHPLAAVKHSMGREGEHP